MPGDQISDGFGVSPRSEALHNTGSVQASAVCSISAEKSLFKMEIGSSPACVPNTSDVCIGIVRFSSYYCALSDVQIIDLTANMKNVYDNQTLCLNKNNFHPRNQQLVPA